MKFTSDILKIALLIGLIFVQFEDFEQLHASLGKADYYIVVLIRMAIFLLGFHIIKDSLIRLYKRKVTIVKWQDNFMLGMKHIYNLVVLLGILIAVMALFKVDVKQFFISLSVVAAAIAILFKDHISNMLNGMIITFSDDLSIGDFVKIGEHKGKIIDINLLNVHLLNDDDDLIFISNNTVANANILNYTKRETKKISIDFTVNLSHLESVKNLETDIIETLHDYHDRIVPGSFKLKVEDIGKDAIDMKFQYILREHDKDLEREIRARTVRKVVELIKKL